MLCLPRTSVLLGLVVYLLNTSTVAAVDVYPGVRTVHVVNSCHLDIGFADSSAGIINRYFDHHLPLAASVGDQLRKGIAGFTDTKLNFIFQSWVLDAFFDCPPGLGLHCPTEEGKQVIRTAIARKDITWHAFPHNAQLEIMDPALIKAGVEMSHNLDREFGQARKRTLSQRDVPGMTRAVIPILRQKGITAISIGANGGSTPADVPPCFLWRDPASNTSIIVFYTWPGYGELPVSEQRLCLVDGLDHALVVNWNGDNAGPYQAAEYGKRWQMIADAFPRAQIYASTFDNFTSHLEQFQDKLPVVDKEIGDTWIYGVPSDPQKLSRLRVFNRIYAAVDAEVGIETALAHDAVLRNATRFVLKLGEHTWGKDVKRNLLDNKDWHNVDFRRARESPGTSSQFAALESSWWEQRHWGISVALDTLSAAEHKMADSIRQGIAELQPRLPDQGGFQNAQPEALYTCGSTQISFHKHGSIDYIKHDDFVWADADHRVLELQYRSYSAADFSTFFSQYCKSNASWVQHDYGKPGLPSDVEGKLWQPTLKQMHIRRQGQTCSFLLKTSFEGAASSDYGAAGGWTQVDVQDGVVNVTLGLFNKTATRLPEAMFLSFLPTLSAGSWSVNKLGTWIGAEEVVNGGAKHLHGSTDAGMRVSTAGRRLTVSSLDAAVVSFGEPIAFPSPVHQDADTARFGGSFVLWDNLWGTNYVMWWPFSTSPPEPYMSSSSSFPPAWNNDFVARFQMRLEGGHVEPKPIWV